MLQQLCPRQRKARFQARIEIRNRRYDVRDRALACAIPMIIQGLDYGNDLNLNYNDFFLPRMVENLDEWINSKKVHYAGHHGYDRLEEGQLMISTGSCRQ